MLSIITNLTFSNRFIAEGARQMQYNRLGSLNIGEYLLTETKSNNC